MLSLPQLIPEKWARRGTKIPKINGEESFNYEQPVYWKFCIHMGFLTAWWRSQKVFLTRVDIEQSFNAVVKTVLVCCRTATRRVAARSSTTPASRPSLSNRPNKVCLRRLAPAPMVSPQSTPVSNLELPNFTDNSCYSFVKFIYFLIFVCYLRVWF